MGDQDLDPLFVDAENLDFHLQEESPCRSSGRYGGDRGAVFGTTSVDENPTQPLYFTLANNYPNPFNAATMIEYSLPQSSHVTIEIYDMLGRRVTTLVDGTKSAGAYQVTWNAANQSSGAYYYRITTDTYSLTRKMTLLK